MAADDARRLFQGAGCGMRVWQAGVIVIPLFGEDEAREQDKRAYYGGGLSCCSMARAACGKTA